MVEESDRDLGDLVLLAGCFGQLGLAQRIQRAETMNKDRSLMDVKEMWQENVGSHHPPPSPDSMLVKS